MSVTITLESLEERHPGVTASIAGAYYEAASVSFSKYHEPPANVVVIDGTIEKRAQTNWDVPSARVLAALANDIDATEQGAYCVSLATLEAVRGLVAISRAETLTGADYYVASAGTEPDDLEEAFRLEVSGVGGGDASDVRKRVGVKKAQAARGKSDLPALVSVVGFNALLIHIDDVK
jgi:hypothetical protein